MSEHQRKRVGILLLILAIGVASWQALLVSCSAEARSTAVLGGAETARGPAG